MTLSDLISIAPPPPHPRNAVSRGQWDAIEQELGTALPEDYKQFWSLYGEVQLLEYLGLLNPLDLRYGLVGRQNDFVDWYRNQDCFPVWPAPGGLLNIGSDEDSHLLFWVTKGTPDEWKTVFFDNNLLIYEYYPMSLTSFLCGFLLGSFHPSFLPRDIRTQGRRAVSQVGPE